MEVSDSLSRKSLKRDVVVLDSLPSGVQLPSRIHDVCLECMYGVIGTNITTVQMLKQDSSDTAKRYYTMGYDGIQ